jgi:hypothetical protein
MVVVPFLRNCCYVFSAVYISRQNIMGKIFGAHLDFSLQVIRRSFPRNLAENSKAASFLGQTTSFETEVQEREPWDFYEWITCNEKSRCASNIFPIMF